MQYLNKSQILEKAIPIAKRLHEAAVWTIRQQIPLADSEIMPGFYVEWIKAEIKRLWGVEIVREEAEYLWLKSLIGF